MSSFIKVECITSYSPFTTKVCTWSSANCDSKQVGASPIMYSLVDYLDGDHFSWNEVTPSPPSNFPQKIIGFFPLQGHKANAFNF
jgi:hypothetical protein